MISFVFWWLCGYKKVCFCCFVQILSYDTVREGKVKLQIRPQFSKEQNFSFKGLSVKNNCMYTVILVFFMSPGIEVNTLLTLRIRIVSIFPSALS